MAHIGRDMRSPPLAVIRRAETENQTSAPDRAVYRCLHQSRIPGHIQAQAEHDRFRAAGQNHPPRRPLHQSGTPAGRT